MPNNTPREVEWPTLALVALCYLLWFAAAFGLAEVSATLALAAMVLALVLHSSLQHEVLHGHPFRNPHLNEALVFLPLGLVYPYRRFRDLHLAHHKDENLTDPYDDPESNYLDPAVWAGLPPWRRLVLRANNSLLGRMTLGPAIGTLAFLRGDLSLLRKGAPGVRRAWLLHAAGLAVVAAAVSASPMSGWLYALAAYLALSVLKIRTFLEHRAHQMPRGRTVIVEGQGLLSFLFLNNNLHVVHHARPRLAWYRLSAAYRDSRAEWLRRNEGYIYPSYRDIFRRYFLKPKDPVPHPMFRR